MKITILLKIPGEPVAQGRPRFHVRNGFASVYDPPASREYKQRVATFARSHYGWEPIEGNVKVSCSFYVGIPKSWTKAKRNMALEGELRPGTKPDWDNYAKALCDGLNGICYKDDGQIVEASASLWYSDEPRTEVEVTEI